MSMKAYWKDQRDSGGKTAAPSSAAGGKELFQAIGTFFTNHGLKPTPANYTLAHAAISGSDPRIAHAIAVATDGGIRLSQAQADEIAGRARANDNGRGGVSAAELARMIGEAQARFDQFAGIVDSSREDARLFGETLEKNAAGLSQSPELDMAAVAALLDVTNSMIDTTRKAEQRLRTTSSEMAELRASLAAARQDAETDPLTSLPNRRAFDSRFAEIQSRATAEGRALSLALCDIDRFKLVNDNHGHDVGDRVIQLIAKELVRGCAGHVVGRHGGEEFVVLFEGLAGSAAYAMLDETRAALSGRNFKIAGTGRELGALSFSGGVVQLEDGEDCAGAIRRADAALYRAKQTGRNRIEAA